MVNHKVSIIIPTYNHASYLPDAIKSVLSQTFKNFEIIVVNDGSTDNTVDVLQPYMGMIKYIYKDNGGLSSARNVGIRNSTGEYIVFLDADDMLMPDKLKIQSVILDENPDIGMVYSDEYIIYGDDKDKKYTARDGRQLPSGNIFKDLFLESFIAVMTAMVRRTCFDRIGFFDESLLCNEDDDMWLRIATQWSILFSDYRSAIRRIHSSNMSRDRLKMERFIVIVLERTLDRNPNLINELGEKAYARIRMLRLSLFKRYVRKGDLDNARCELERCRIAYKLPFYKYFSMLLILSTGRSFAAEILVFGDWLGKFIRIPNRLFSKLFYN